MNTQFLLMARYDGVPIIPLEQVQRDYFPHLKLAQLQAKLLRGDIPLPVVRLDPDSQKSARGVPLTDLAAYIDTRTEAARKELRQVTGGG